MTARTPMPRKWDAIRHEPYDDEHYRALQGYPHYWKLDWGYMDIIVEPCGMKRRVPVEWLEDPDRKIAWICPWAEDEDPDASHTHLV